MTFRILARFFLLFPLLISSAFAKNNYSATAVVDDPPYGLVAQLWNGSAFPIYVTHIDVTTTNGGMLNFGIGYSNLEQSDCTSFSVIAADPVAGPTVITGQGIRPSAQPCTPGGHPYSVTNYTLTNLFNLANCFGSVCSLEFPQGVTIPPNHGVTIYTAFFVNGSWANGWTGYAAVNFRWHN